MDIAQMRKDFEEYAKSELLIAESYGFRSEPSASRLFKAGWQAAHAHYAKPAAPVVLPQHPDTARLQQAVWRLEDILKDDDGQAWKEASKFLERLKKEQWQEAQQQADALDAERYRWLRDDWLNNEPEAINMERAKGQRGLDAAIDAAIAAAKGNK